MTNEEMITLFESAREGKICCSWCKDYFHDDSAGIQSEFDYCLTCFRPIPDDLKAKYLASISDQ